jgi:tetratricopeptide (TPR) repeat protein
MGDQIQTKSPHLGTAVQLHRQGRVHDALAYYQQALQEGVTPDVLLGMGAALHDLEQYGEALDLYRHALELAPQSAQLHHNRGNTLLALDRCSEAIESYRCAAALLPKNPEPLVTMGMAFERLLRHDEAMECYDVALRCDATCAEAHWNRALLNLKLGRFVEGWEEFEWRWKKRGYTTALRDFGVPLWNGEWLEGGTILVHAEQAFGDAIQFARYLPLVAARCGRLILESPPPLCEILATMSGVSEAIPSGSPLPRCDRHVPLMSLPGIFTTTMETVPRTVPYLSPPLERLNIWKQLLAPWATVKAGLVWAGRKMPDPLRSCRLADLAPLAAIQGITFFSLQMDEASHEAASPPQGMPLVDLTDHITDFADTAAFISQLDLVITIDTSVAHLSGALGKPTFVLLPYVSDWRWMLKRSDSPWYPTMRLFRQSARGDWREPVQEMAAAVAGLHAASAQRMSRCARGITPAAVEQYEVASRLMDGHRFDEAREQLMKLVCEYPQWSLPCVLLGLSCYSLGNTVDAEHCFRKAISIDGECTEAYRCLGLLLNEQERFQDAVMQFLQAVSLAPVDGELLRSLADAHYGAGNLNDACHWYRKALAIQPDHIETLINLGVASELVNRHDDALQLLAKARELAPHDYRPDLNMGGVYFSLNRLNEAEEYFKRALERRPGDATIRWNLAQIDLTRGNYRQGFQEFEARFDKKRPVKVDLHGLPLWDGSSLSGKTLLVVTEQAFGDAIQFCRFLPVLAQRGGRILLYNNLKPLDTLLATLPLVERVISQGEQLPPCDWAVPMLSIPRLMNMTLETLPNTAPYLFPEKERCRWWQEYLRCDSGFKVGIAWKGRSKPDPRRSADVACFSLLKDIPGVSWYSLQVSERGETLPPLPVGFDLRDPTPLLKDFADTAALMSQLDLVISIDSAVAHLAGALGRPTWLLLPFSADWRWMLERADSPWYPTMRLFRQPAPGAWETVFAQVASTLVKITSNRGFCKSISHARMLLSGIHDFNSLQAGFPTKTASGMTKTDLCKRLNR